jgi:hypothetical protein
MPETVDHPSHYTAHPSGVECIAITEHFNFCIGNAIKYLWRAGLKEGADELEDLQKALWYIKREIERRAGKGGRATEERHELAEAITRELFTNGSGEVADRLVLVRDAPDRSLKKAKNLGGWCWHSFLSVVEDHLIKGAKG